MKQIFFAFITLLLLPLVSCDSRKTIPDKELASIFHDAMVVNAYLGHKSLNLDSLNIYEPIFEHYGYTTEDVRYTIAGFLRRKSANLSDVVDEVIYSIEKEYDALEIAVAKLDTIEHAAQRHAQRRLVQDTAIVVKKARDTVKLHYEIPFEGAGEYQISGCYTIDENDKSKGRRFTVRKLLRDSTTAQLHSSMMHFGEKSKSSSRIHISDRDAEEILALQINFDDFRLASKKDKKEHPRPKVSKMTLHEVNVVFTPTVEHSVEKLYDDLLGLRIFSDTMFFPSPQDSVATIATDSLAVQEATIAENAEEKSEKTTEE